MNGTTAGSYTAGIAAGALGQERYQISIDGSTDRDAAGDGAVAAISFGLEEITGGRVSDVQGFHRTKVRCGAQICSKSGSRGGSKRSRGTYGERMLTINADVA